MNFFLVILIFVLALSGYANFKLYTQHADDEQKIEHAKSEISKLERDLITARNQAQSEYDQEKQLIQSLDDQIKAKNTELTRAQDRLKSIGNGNSAGNNPSTLEWDIRHQKELIADLEKELQALQGEEGEAGNISKLTQNQIKAQREVAENEVQNQINLQEQSLKDLQNQLTQARHDHLTKDALLNLQAQVNSEKQTISSLKAQKQNLKLQYNENLGSTQGQSQAAIAGFRQNERNLKERITTEKNHLSELQKAFDSSKKLTNQNMAQISQIQKELTSLRQDMDRLTSERTLHVKRLATLAPR